MYTEERKQEHSDFHGESGRILAVRVGQTVCLESFVFTEPL